ncbi:bacterial Ig-like domain (group 3) [Lentilactobacillus sunkii]|jgi:surface protein|uniref:Bacterial Ig-like domain (Group 3) n=1 Tax=Lentilactobacillus sunkii TaxID=481719 RepID=A0A1E7XEL3_9LACO|nr:BspA family leucine-rich repeat surface protein [Lentilactobacillus sunkii]OFA11432.1 bacterial Ig-like domain (group 3) [Lentilactobacillus sunkii]
MNQGLKRFLGVLLTVIGIFLFFGTFAKADTSLNTMPTNNTSQMSKNDPIPQYGQSGKIGTVDWRFDGDHTLYIGPGTITSDDLPAEFAEVGDNYPWNGVPAQYIVAEWYLWKRKVTTMVIEGRLHLEGKAPVDFFGNMNNLTTIVGMENVDTSKATSMSRMFNYSRSLPSIDLSHLDSSNVTDMSMMFSTVFADSLDLSPLDTSKVTNMWGMFREAGIKHLNLNSFNTSSVTDMNSMFFYANQLVGLDVSHFDTRNVTDMGWMFGNLPQLTTLDLNNFVTPNLLTSASMFSGDYSLKSLDLSNFDTTKVTNMRDMFAIDQQSNRQSQLSKLVLGPKVNLLSDAPLPAPLGSDKWQAVDKGTITKPLGRPAYLPDDLIALYGAANSKHPTGTQTWVPGGDLPDSTTLNVHNVTIYVGDRWDPKLAFTSATDIDGNPIGLDKITVLGTVKPDVPGDYQVTYTYTYPYPYTNEKVVKNIWVHVRAKVSPKPNPTPVNPTPAPKPTPNNPNWNPSDPNHLNGTGLPNYAAVKGSAVYATKKIYMYKHGNFKKSQHIATYPKQKRINRPMFVVTGYARSHGGALRYKVRDVNHHSKTAGKRGYITANRKYVVRVYYQSVPKKKLITVINLKGVHAYKNKNLTKQVKHFKKGSHLRVKKIVKWNLTTRYQLTDGTYVTANKKLVIQGKY